MINIAWVNRGGFDVFKIIISEQWWKVHSFLALFALSLATALGAVNSGERTVVSGTESIGTFYVYAGTSPGSDDFEDLDSCDRSNIVRFSPNLS